MSTERLPPAQPAATVEGRALEDRIVAARGKMPLLYRLLLNSPSIADGWEQLLTAVRQKADLPPILRELVVLRVSAMNGADVEFQGHQNDARQAGLTDAQIAAARSGDRSAYNAVELLVIEYAEVMTREIDVPEELFQRVVDQFGVRVCIDLTVTIAAYNMVTRVLVALKVH